MDVIKAVYALRAPTTNQLYALYFNNDKHGNPKPIDLYDSSLVNSRCVDRLRGLYDLGYLDRIEQPSTLEEGSKPLLHVLDKESIPLLAEILDVETQDIDWKPSDNDIKNVDHLIKSNDLRVSMVLDARLQSWQILSWLDQRALDRVQKQNKKFAYVSIDGADGDKRPATTVGDAYFHLYDGKYNHFCFIEIDTGSETVESLKRDTTVEKKIKVYLAWWKTGAYRQMFGNKPMKVAFVTSGSKRLANLKTVAEKLGGNEMFYFTAFADIPFGTALSKNIWEVAGKNGRHNFVA